MSNEEHRSALYDHRDAYNGSLKKGDLEGWLDTLTDDCVFMGPGSPALNGKEAVRRWARDEMLGAFDVELDYDFEETEFLGSTATGWGWFRQTLTPKAGGEPVLISGKFLDVFKQDEQGQWRLARCAYSPDHG